jgi:hypothetical protein
VSLLVLAACSGSSLGRVVADDAEAADGAEEPPYVNPDCGLTVIGCPGFGSDACISNCEPLPSVCVANPTCECIFLPACDGEPDAAAYCSDPEGCSYDPATGRFQVTCPSS